MIEQQLRILDDIGIVLTETELDDIINSDVNNLNVEDTVKLASICNILYRSGLPIVSDDFYDHTVIEHLVVLDPENPYLNQVEPENISEGKLIRLPKLMLSTNKAYKLSDIDNWIQDINLIASSLDFDPKYIVIRVTPKLDGFACFDDGKKLYSRGDGRDGSDITHILNRGVIVQGGIRGEGPGEIVISKKYFLENLSEVFDNTRNFQGSVINSKELNPIVQKTCDDGAMVFYPFALLPSWEGTVDDLLENFDTINKSLKESVDYDVDGIVLEVTNTSIKEAMGSTRHHHRWQIAFKENEDSIDMNVIDVIPQTGKTGRITPVAILEPQRISGVMVSRVTAHNYGHVLKWQLGKGSVVKVLRAGLVIPKIVGVVKESIVKIPDICPSCGSKTGWDNDNLYCSNLTNCPAQVENKLLYFFQTLNNNDGFGPKTIEILHRNNINNVSEVYRLTEQQFSDMGFGPGETRVLLRALSSSLTTPIDDWRFLAAFGIPNIGKGGCELLLKHYPLSEVFNLTREHIMAIRGFADKSADTIINTLKSIKQEFDLLSGLKFNLLYTPIGGNKTTKSPITGKSIVFTGSMEVNSRSVLEEQAKNLGARVGSSVNSKTDYLIIGSDPGANKIKGAQQYGTTTLNEQEYLELLSE